MHRSEFLKALKDQLPALTQKVNAEQGLLHFEVEVLRRFAQEAINRHEHEALVKSYKLADDACSSGNANLKDAIDVSFVEPLAFQKSDKWAWEIMPQQLKDLYVRFHGSKPV